MHSEVVPSIRKFGSYTINKKYRKELEKNNKKLEVLIANQKKNKFDVAGLLYAIRPRGVDENLIKIGKTSNINKRLNTLNTGSPDKIEVLFILKVSKCVC